MLWSVLWWCLMWILWCMLLVLLHWKYVAWRYSDTICDKYRTMNFPEMLKVRAHCSKTCTKNSDNVIFVFLKKLFSTSSQKFSDEPHSSKKEKKWSEHRKLDFVVCSCFRSIWRLKIYKKLWNDYFHRSSASSRLTFRCAVSSRGIMDWRARSNFCSSISNDHESNLQPSCFKSESELQWWDHWIP